MRAGWCRPPTLHLRAAGNKITRIEGLATLSALEELWCNDNLLATWRDIDLLRPNPEITCVYFERNPIAADTAYRRKLKLTLPQLVQVGGPVVCVCLFISVTR